MKKTLFALAIVSTIVLVSCEEKKSTEGTPNASTEASTTTSTPTTGTDTSKSATAANTTASKTVVDIAIGSADHTTLVAAVKAADLVATLSGKGPFTVFAPTNAAFDKLPKGTVEGLLKAEKKADLASILTYHVIAGAVKAADLKDGQIVKTVNGKELKVSIKDGKVSIGGANVTAVDLTSENGVVHVIDAVLLPK